MVNQESISENAELDEIQCDWDLEYQLFRVNSDYLIDNTFILRSDSSLEILLSPWIVGANLAGSAQVSSAEFLRVAFEICPDNPFLTVG
ncbi:MAG: hypothetical protein ACOC38_00620 [Promethearchaeia archaeon]